MSYIWKWEAVEQRLSEMGFQAHDTKSIWLRFKVTIPENERITEKQFTTIFKPSDGKPRPNPLQKTVDQFARFLNVEWTVIAQKGNGSSYRNAFEKNSDDDVKAIRPARLHILRPVDMAYSNDLIFAFLADLYRYRDKVSVDTHIAIPGCKSDYDGEGKKKHIEYAKHVVKRQREEKDRDSIIVTVGTPPLLALRDHLGPAFKETPILFLGCTLPNHDEYGIVSQTENRVEQTRIAGVCYNKEIQGLFGFLHNKVLKNSRAKLVYFYRPELSMDDLVRKSFDKYKRSIPKGERGLAVILRSELSGDREEPDKEALYFGWHSAEILFQDPESRSLLQKYMIVSPTRRFVQHGLTAIGYQADDFEVGRSGARLLVDYLKSNKELGEFDIVSPKPKPWVHKGKLEDWEKAFGFQLPEVVRHDENTEWFD